MDYDAEVCTKGCESKKKVSLNGPHTLEPGGEKVAGAWARPQTSGSLRIAVNSTHLTFPVPFPPWRKKGGVSRTRHRVREGAHVNLLWRRAKTPWEKNPSPRL